MRAAYIEAPGPPETIIIGDRPVPDAGPGQVRLLVHAAGIGPWDAKTAMGRFGNLKLPYVLGFEFSGVVDQVGGEVAGIEVGDAVYGTDWFAGSAADYRVAAAAALALKPKAFTHVEAAAMVVAGTTALEGLLERLGIGQGETVLVTGASGGVGTIALQLARDAGATVIGVASREHHPYMLALGAHETFDYHDDDWVEKVRERTGGVDALFDIAGGETLQRAFGAVKDGGRAVGVVYTGPDEAPRGIAFERFSAGSGRARLERLAAIADAGRLRVEIEAELPLEGVREAFQRVLTGHTRGKVVLKLV